MGNKELKIICYADDAIIMAEIENDLQRLLYEFYVTAKQYMSISTEKKTKTLVVTKEPIRRKCIERMANNKIVKIARDKSPNRRRSMGRPRKRWSDDI